MPHILPSKRSSVRKIASIGSILGLSVIFLCLTLIALEFVLRWLGLGDPVLYRPNASYRYAVLPDQHKERIQGAKVTIDSYGLRTVEDWAEPDSLKILFIGDSVTWGGTGVDDKNTFAHMIGVQIEERLNRPVVTGNAGVNGYGTDNMAARLRHENLGEDLLVIVLISGDTIRGLADIRSSYFFTRRPPWPFPALWEFTTFSLWSISSRMRIIRDSVDPGSNAVATESLNRLFEVLREKQSTGIPVLLVLSPYEDELGGNGGQLTQHVRLSLANSGFPFLDLHPFITGAADKSLYSDGIHLNEHGHSVYSREIGSYILGLIGNDPNSITRIQKE